MCAGVELIGVAVSPVAGLVFAAINVGAEVPLRIPCNNEVEPAIAVVIYEGRACAPTAAADARLGSDIGESPVAIIVIKSVSAEVRHQKVNVAVVVEHCDSRTHGLRKILLAGATGLVLKANAGVCGHIFKEP